MHLIHCAFPSQISLSQREEFRRFLQGYNAFCLLPLHFKMVGEQLEVKGKQSFAPRCVVTLLQTLAMYFVEKKADWGFLVDGECLSDLSHPVVRLSIYLSLRYPITLSNIVLNPADDYLVAHYTTAPQHIRVAVVSLRTLCLQAVHVYKLTRQSLTEDLQAELSRELPASLFAEWARMAFPASERYEPAQLVKFLKDDEEASAFLRDLFYGQQLSHGHSFLSTKLTDATHNQLFLR